MRKPLIINRKSGLVRRSAGATQHEAPVAPTTNGIPRTARYLGETSTGPIYRLHAAAWVAPPRVAFALLSELGRRAVDPDAKVVSTAAGWVGGDQAAEVLAVHTGLACGSLFSAPSGSASAIRRSNCLSARQARRYRS